MIRSVTAGLLTVAGAARTARALAIAGLVAAAALGGAYLFGYLRSAHASIVPSQGNVTYLLFSFLSNQSGFDTGISISNTSADPFGTPQQSGTCTLYFYGSAAPSNPVTTPSVAAGTTYASLTSVLAPGFQGYMIAACNFRYAHGWGFFSDVGAQKLAASVPVNVITMLPRPNNENLNN